jgi:hypothetical protein
LAGQHRPAGAVRPAAALTQPPRGGRSASVVDRLLFHAPRVPAARDYEGVDPGGCATGLSTRSRNCRSLSRCRLGIKDRSRRCVYRPGQHLPCAGLFGGRDQRSQSRPATRCHALRPSCLTILTVQSLEEGIRDVAAMSRKRWDGCHVPPCVQVWYNGYLRSGTNACRFRADWALDRWRERERGCQLQKVEFIVPGSNARSFPAAY